MIYIASASEGTVKEVLKVLTRRFQRTEASLEAIQIFLLQWNNDIDRAIS